MPVNKTSIYNSGHKSRTLASALGQWWVAAPHFGVSGSGSPYAFPVLVLPMLAAPGSGFCSGYGGNCKYCSRIFFFILLMLDSFFISDVGRNVIFHGKLKNHFKNVLWNSKVNKFVKLIESLTRRAAAVPSERLWLRNTNPLIVSSQKAISIL